MRWAARADGDEQGIVRGGQRRVDGDKHGVDPGELGRLGDEHGVDWGELGRLDGDDSGVVLTFVIERGMSSSNGRVPMPRDMLNKRVSISRHTPVSKERVSSSRGSCQG